MARGEILKGPRFWWEFWQLSRRRLRSIDDYRAFQYYQGRRLVENLLRWGCQIRGNRILDLGCGYGGYAIALEEAGAHVIALDLSSLSCFPSRKVLAVQGNGLHLPFLDGAFDGVFCASLIEHVANPLQLLREIRRVLKLNGWAYLSFPPFYSPLGGHQFSPFHYLGERMALIIAHRRKWWGGSHWIPSCYPTKPSSFAQAFGDYGLYPMTIRKARKVIQQAGFRIAHQGVRFFPVNVSKIPLIGEFITWHVEFVIQP